MSWSDPSPTAHLRLCVLGPVHAEVDGGWSDLGPVRQQAVFAMLLFHRDRVVTPEAILDGVWGDEVPACGKKVIPPYVYRLRRILGATTPDGSGPTIETLRVGYRLRLGAAVVDLDEVEEAAARATTQEAAGDPRAAVRTLADADRAWTGEPLAGLPGPFARSRRLHLVDRRVVGLERRLELQLRLGDVDATIPVLAALRAEFPLRERIASMLMVALYRTGRQGEAVTVFENLRADLTSQLGIEPTPATTEVYVSMLRGRPGLPRAEGRVADLPDALTLDDVFGALRVA